jgi:hypothetical protein
MGINVGILIVFVVDLAGCVGESEFMADPVTPVKGI